MSMTRQGERTGEADFVSGDWSGTWQSNRGGHGGTLTCRIEPAGEGQWKAHFTAHSDRVETFHIQMTGNQVDDRVIFGGEVDLGPQNGGVYDWTGEVTPSSFDGQYHSQHDTGSFRMSPETS